MIGRREWLRRLMLAIGAAILPSHKPVGCDCVEPRSPWPGRTAKEVHEFFIAEDR